jgi:hypothetical protein
MPLGQFFDQFWAWLIALPPDFAFLLSLPFVVAGAAVMAGLARRQKGP